MVLDTPNTYVVDICYSRLTKAILTNIHNMCYLEKITKKSSPFLPIKLLYASIRYSGKFFLTAKSKGTNTVVRFSVHLYLAYE